MFERKKNIAPFLLYHVKKHVQTYKVWKIMSEWLELPYKGKQNT